VRRVPEDRKYLNQVFYVTIVTRAREALLTDLRAAQLILNSFAFFVRQKEIVLVAYVIMPDHLHVILQVKPPLTLSGWASRFKSFTTHEQTGTAMWQHGYWSELVVTEGFAREKLVYMHNNPVRAKLSCEATHYPWSSAAQYESGVFDSVTPYWMTEGIGMEPDA
jgi:putative transposase